MKNEEINSEDKKVIPTLPEISFWQKEDPRWELIEGKASCNRKLGSTINLKNDSYVWCYSGPRGSGKTITMSYFAAMAMMMGIRVVSNYDIKFNLADGHGNIREMSSEPLDLYKILVFDSEFKNCLILMDEAPLIISHLSSMSWKNRLLDIFMQQIRKNRNSFFYASQNERWVDYQLRWQTDLVFKCRDASRRYQGGGLGRGDSILLDIIDQSGMWTGYSYDERPVVYAYTLAAKKFFGIYDTYHQMDVFECLKRVDMKLTSYKVGAHEDEDTSHLDMTEEVIGNLVSQGIKRIRTSELYDSLGELTARQKDSVAKHLVKMGVTRGRPTPNGYVYYLKNVKLVEVAE